MMPFIYFLIASSFIARPISAFHHPISQLPYASYRTRKSCLWVHNNRKEGKHPSQCRPKHEQEMHNLDRRDYLRCLSSSIVGTVGMFTLPFTAATITLTMFPFRPARAEESSSLDEQQQRQRMVFDRRPIAPTGALVPATEQRMLLKECLMLSEQLKSTPSNNSSNSSREAAIRRLRSILVNPNDEGSGGYNYYTKGLTEKKRSERDRQILSQYQQPPPSERKLSGNIIRATMNIYITNLRYGRDYTVQASESEWKSDYIRANGGLPDYQRLIQADLDLRILYMNQVQIRVDDAAAEFYFAFGKQNSNDASNVGVDEETERESIVELQRLLRLAMESMDAWFSRIGDLEAEEASTAVAEGKYLKIVDNSYTAGFVPPVRE